jgi:MFS family permease
MRGSTLVGGQPRTRWALAVLAVGVLDLGLEQAIVAPALPAIERHYRASPTAGTWLLTGFVLAAAIAIPLGGRLGDRLGRRRTLVWSLVLFALGSLVCALSDTIGLLTVGRIVQGLGAGVAPLALGLARDSLPPARLPRAVGVLVAAGSAGSVAGLVLAGILVDHVSVAAIFWLLLAVALVLAGLVWTVVPESPERGAELVDVVGALVLAGGLASLTLAVSEGNAWGWGSARTLLLLGAAVVLTGAFVARERTAAAPLLDPHALALRSIWSANVAMCAVGFSLLIALTLVPMMSAYPQSTGYGLGLSTTQIGLVLVPSAIAALLGGLLGGRFIAGTGARLQALCGVLLACFTYVTLAATRPSVAVLALAMIPLGVGIGLALGAITDLVALASPASQTAGAVGLNTVIRTVAAALGAQVAIAVVTAAPPAFPTVGALIRHLHRLGGGGPRLERLVAVARIPAHSGFTDAFWMAAGATALALLAIALTPPRHTDPIRLSAAR